MTLTTSIRIVEPTPIDPIWREANRILGTKPDTRYKDKTKGTPYVEGGSFGYRNHRRMNESNGNHALLWIEWGADGPLVDDPHEDHCEPGEKCYCPPPASIQVTFDTAYGYTGPNGGSCTDLHAWLVRELGDWLTARGLTWFWLHEYTGDWHPASDPVTILGDPDKGALLQPA